MDNEYLIFMSDKQGVLPSLKPYIKKEEIFKTVYKDNCNFNSFLFRAMRKSGTPIISVMFDSWKKNLNENIKNIIILDTAYNKHAVKIIRKKCKNCKIILYYWNKINDYIKNYLKDEEIDEFFTFDLEDAKKYNIKYNPQFYTKNLKLNNEKIEKDVLFIGRAKKRKEEIINIDNRMKEMKINTNILIIEKEKDYINYEEYLKMLSKSKAILDIVEGNQIGLTLRCMESLFLNKKLITNNIDIHNYDFYNPNNIFIIGKDDINNIKNFIDSEYEPVKKEIVDYYDYESWIKRFGV